MANDNEVLRLAVQERRALELKRLPTVLRRCLRCDWMFHSTGSDHRLCNVCKSPYPQPPDSPVGRRILSAPQQRRGGRPCDDLEG